MRNFILGVGAQKAGTTWLHRQFAAQTHYRLPHDKEMHVLDSVYLYDEMPFGKWLTRKASETLQKAEEGFRTDFSLKRLQMFLDIDVYFDYFDALLEADGLYTCDITPSYSALPEDVLVMIRDKFKERGIETRVVFLMREPVSRLESAVKMSLRTSTGIDDVSEDDMAERLARHCGSRSDRHRSSYRSIVNRLLNVFGKDNVFLGYYETMFTASEQDRIAKAFDLDIATLDTKTRVNFTSKSFTYPPDLIADLRSRYEDEYDFVLNDLKLDPEIWEKSLTRLSK